MSYKARISRGRDWQIIVGHLLFHYQLLHVSYLWLTLPPALSALTLLSWCAFVVAAEAAWYYQHDPPLAGEDGTHQAHTPRSPQGHSTTKDGCIAWSTGNGFVAPLAPFPLLNEGSDLTPALAALWAISWVNGTKIVLVFGFSCWSSQNPMACHIRVIYQPQRSPSSQVPDLKKLILNLAEKSLVGNMELKGLH